LHPGQACRRGIRREKGNVPMLKYLLVLLCLAAPAAAEVQTTGPPPGWLKSVSCRIVSREGGTYANMRALNDVIVDTLSKNPFDYTLNTVITGGRMLGASVRHVYIDMPRPVQGGHDPGRKDLSPHEPPRSRYLSRDNHRRSYLHLALLPGGQLGERGAPDAGPARDR